MNAVELTYLYGRSWMRAREPNVAGSVPRRGEAPQLSPSQKWGAVNVPRTTTVTSSAE